MNKEKITKELVDRIVGAISVGASRETAARSVGISKATFFNWLSKGKRQGSREIYRDLVDKVEEADAKFEVCMGSIITEAAEKNWCAAAWWLERKYPERYAKRDHVTASVNTTVIPLDMLLREKILKDKEIQAGIDKLLEAVAEADAAKGIPAITEPDQE